MFKFLPSGISQKSCKLCIRHVVQKHNYRKFSEISHNVVKTKSNHFKKKLFGVILASGIAYDSTVNDFEYIDAVTRFLRSLKIAASISFDYAWNLKQIQEGTEEYDKIIKEINLRSAERILKGCLANGGLYIKIGQGVSAINHILPKEYTQTLMKLHNECLPRKKNEVKKIFLQDFGKEPEEIFEKFNYEPIAAASLAQVFRATTKDGEEVAVKVQYIDLQKRFSGDIGTILFLQSIIEMVHKNYNFGWIIRDLRRDLEKELDFINEGRNSEKCAKDLAKFPFVLVPKVRWDLTKTRVLTAEFMNGFKASNMDEIKKEKLDVKDIDEKIIKIFSEQIFNTGFVHADPHPANVLIHRGKNNEAEIIVLDHGLYQQISDHVRNTLCNFWEAIVLNDHETMQKYAKAIEINDYRKFAEILLQRPLETKARFTIKLTEKEIAYMQEIAKKRFDIIMDTLKEMPRSMLFVLRNLNTIRALAREHGDPVDRQKLMARHAMRCVYKESGFFGHLKYICRRIRFEYNLFRMSFKYWFIRSYLNLLTTLGRAPDTSILFQIDQE